MAAADRVVCVAALPTKVTVASSYLPPMSMPIFWPTSKPVVLVTGRLVDPAGIVSHGPVDTGMNTVVRAEAAVPMLAIVWFSPSMLIFCPTSKPEMLRTLIVVAPFVAGADKPEPERPSR